MENKENGSICDDPRKHEVSSTPNRHVTKLPVVDRAAAYSKLDAAKPDYQKRADLGWQYLMRDVRKAIDRSVLWYKVTVAALMLIAGVSVLWITGIFF